MLREVVTNQYVSADCPIVKAKKKAVLNAQKTFIAELGDDGLDFLRLKLAEDDLSHIQKLVHNAISHSNLVGLSPYNHKLLPAFYFTI
jgi:hypothetical protein